MAKEMLLDKSSRSEEWNGIYYIESGESLRRKLIYKVATLSFHTAVHILLTRAVVAVTRHSRSSCITELKNIFVDPRVPS